jgi:hypothetical protein
MMPSSAAGAEFQAYLEARDAVRRIKDTHRMSGAAAPSAYWTEELDQIDYLADASPLIIRKLRHHAFHITGIRPYDYRHQSDGRRETFEARLEALRAIGGESLLVPESPALGGFGYDIGGRLFNIDTLKFYEVLIGMQRGGVLGALRAIERPVVCEIGAGWGGFAYQFKTLFPGVTYVIVDFPELFLFSATYLKTVCPDAKLRFVGTSAEVSLDGWRDADFVFVPNALASVVASLPLDLTVNMVSFQEMTDEQVRGYARLAADAACPLLYSLNRERSRYNSELVSVTEALSDSYRLTEVTVLGTDYTTAMKKAPDAARADVGYRHHVGRLDRKLTRAVRSDGASASAPAPRVVLGMTLHNNAPHLREALDSLLGQTYTDFVLLLLDDASSDDTEAIAREYEATDRRVRYFRHAERQAMIATWREVAELAAREYPSAGYFAWVSDHDRWHPRWLESLVTALDEDSGVVLAYPITRRLTAQGVEIDKGPRLFDTIAAADLRSRWAHFCRHGVGAGDMVYGLMRLGALQRAGIFRTVLRPDRLLIAELTLIGGIRQVPEVLWFRRQSSSASIARQRHTLVVAGQEPRWFLAPPWFQHALALWREYARPTPPPLPIDRRTWVRMLIAYQLRYGWRHLRKSETSHAAGRAINRAIWIRKMAKHYYHHAVYHTLVGSRVAWARTARTVRRGVYHLLVFTHRIGLRGGNQGTPTP